MRAPGGGGGGGAAVAGTAAVLAAAAATALAHVPLGRRLWSALRSKLGGNGASTTNGDGKPQQRFGVVYADTSDAPFPHLPPQPAEADADDATNRGTAADHPSDGNINNVSPPAAAGAEGNQLSGALGSGGGGGGVRGASAPAPSASPGQAQQQGQPLTHPYLPTIQRLMTHTSTTILAVPPLSLPASAGPRTSSSHGTSSTGPGALLQSPQGSSTPTVAAQTAPAAGASAGEAATVVDTATLGAGAAAGEVARPGRKGGARGGSRPEGLPSWARWVDTPEELYALGQRLRRERQVGVDLEHHALRSYLGVTCLLQLSVREPPQPPQIPQPAGHQQHQGEQQDEQHQAQQGGSSSSPAFAPAPGAAHGSPRRPPPPGETWLVDVLSPQLHDHVGAALGPLMADPRVVKVVHGGSNDVCWLQRDFRIYMVNVFDTEKACQVLGYESRSLTTLLQRYCGSDAVGGCSADEKRLLQRADWRRRPLPPPLLRYAAADAAHLPYLADVLRAELAAMGPPPRTKAPAPSTAEQGAPPPFVTADLVIMAPTQPTRPDAEQQPQHDGSGDGPVGLHVCRPTPTPLGQAVLRSHQLSLSLYRKPLSDAGAAAAAAAAAAAGGEGGRTGAAIVGSASAAAAAVLKKYFAGGAQGGTRPVTGPGATGAAVGVLEGNGTDGLNGAGPVRTGVVEPVVNGMEGKAKAGPGAGFAQQSRTLGSPQQQEGEEQLQRKQPSSGSGIGVRLATNSTPCGSTAAAVAPPSASRPMAPAAAAASAADAVLALCRWRDVAARRADDSPGWVLPDAAVAALAAAAPPPGSGRQLLRVVQDVVDELNRGLEAEPYAARYAVSEPLRRDADALCRLLAAAAAGRGSPAGAVLAVGLDGGAAAGGAGEGLLAMAGVGRRFRHDPEAAKERRSWVIEKFSAKTQVYQNCRMLSREGGLLCYCDTRKLQWYLGRGLAVQVSEDPPTIQLLFEHQNTDQQRGADEFYTQSKSNRCVACGCASHYLRYRVLPACYRKHMPPELKSHRSHDVVLLCIDCHEKAQKASERMKRQVAVDYGVPLLPPRVPGMATALPLPPALAPPQGQQGAAAAASAAQAAPPQATSGGAATVGGKEANGDCAVDGDEGFRMEGDGDGGGGEQGERDGEAEGEGQEGSSEADAEGGEQLAPALPGGVHPSAARRAGLALQKSGPQMPLERVRQLEDLIKTALGRDPRAEEPGLRPGDLQAALLAGLGRRARNKYYKQQQRQPQHATTPPTDQPSSQDQEPQEVTQAASGVLSPASTRAASAATVSAPATQPGAGRLSSPLDPWLDSGHTWHGERVVRLAMARGGEEELMQLVRRFRSCFVEAVRPAFLPPAWGVDHAARRDFGPYSVYAAERRRREEQQQQRDQGQERERDAEEGERGDELEGDKEEEQGQDWAEAGEHEQEER